MHEPQGMGQTDSIVLSDIEPGQTGRFGIERERET